MKEDSIFTNLFNLLFKVIGFVIYCFTKLGEIILSGFNNWLNGILKK